MNRMEPCNYTSTGGLCNHHRGQRENPEQPRIPFFDNLQGGSGGDNECGSSAVALPHPPFPRPRVTLYLIFCFLLSVTAEPSWCVVACCQDCAFKPEEFQPERQRVKASVAGMKSLGESRKRRTKKKKTAVDNRHAASKPPRSRSGRRQEEKKMSHKRALARTHKRRSLGFDVTRRSDSDASWQCQALVQPAALSRLTRRHTPRGRHARRTDRPLRRTKTPMVCKKDPHSHSLFLCGDIINMTDCRVCLRTTGGVEPSDREELANRLYSDLLKAVNRKKGICDLKVQCTKFLREPG